MLDDSALRECHESRGTRYSERHSAHKDAGGRHRRNARHTDPRTTLRYDRARKNLDRHPDNIVAACMVSGPEDRSALVGSRGR